MSLSSSAWGAATCTVDASAMDFGAYDVLSSAPPDYPTTLTGTCARNPPPGSEVVSYTLSLSVGAGSYSARTMSRGAATLQYNLYTSPAMTAATVWGNGTGGSNVVGNSLAPLNGQNRIRLATHTIYGRIPARQDVPTGTYTGNVVLTMEY
jgi:spore coat protein U-like protein